LLKVSSLAEFDASYWDNRYATTERVWSTGPNLFVEDRLRPTEPGAGLDLASGEGRNAAWLAEKGWNMTGVDLSEVAVKKARSLATNAQFEVGDVFDWETNRSFDLVLIAYLQVDASTLETLVRRIQSWLSPGGELFMIGHDVSNLDQGWGGPQTRDALWDIEEITTWLEGMTLFEASVVRRPVVGVESQFARDALVRARVSPQTQPS
jgi:SAM-dependent methyltransferase